MKRVSHRLDRSLTWVLDWMMRIVPIAALVALGAFVAAQQTVSPQRRVVKASVLLGLMALMLRFDMVYSVYLFTLAFPFPSGISIGSTNAVLMTLIPMLWAVRATSTKSFRMRKTIVDAPIILLVFAYIISFVNIDKEFVLVNSAKVLWLHLTCVAYFYIIVSFVTDETKLARLLKVLCVAATAVMLTAILELFFPGTVIIPGWIGLKQQFGAGTLNYRIEGLRAGGAFGSHGKLSDFGTQTILFMVYFALRSKNPLEKALWTVATCVTMTAILGTANRGAMFGLAVGVLYAFYVFRHRVSVLQVSVTLSVVAMLIAGAELALSEHTYAVSVFDRFRQTEFEGLVPDTRTMTWVPALVGGLEHPLFGHGPLYDTGIGLERKFWPHNGYIYYFYTLGLLGIGAFFWVIVRVFKLSRLHSRPEVEGTVVADLLKLAQVWLVILLVEQMRTDHQRDDIYPYIVWMCFGTVAAAGLIIRDQLEMGASAVSRGAERVTRRRRSAP